MKRKKPKVDRCSFCRRTKQQVGGPWLKGKIVNGKISIICFDCIKEKKAELDKDSGKPDAA